MSVIYIRIDNNEKKNLELEAKKLGMQLTTYCRMLLLQSLNKGNKQHG
jgi:antitoxin component of RelBE/YafQ-DinJ toxin-antitoxin module